METQRKTILVIDDEDFISTLIARALKKEGFEVIVANDYNSAIKLIDSCHIDLAVSDVMLPATGGLEILEYIRKKEDTPYVPVILITGMDKDALHHDKVKAEAILSKPFDMRQLISIIRSNLSTSKNSSNASA